MRPAATHTDRGLAAARLRRAANRDGAGVELAKVQVACNPLTAYTAIPVNVGASTVTGR